ncbi:MAG: BlaI/MecI/CopY family transcriptional regulator [Rhodothermus sp.]|nr:BlaI/MecI/CopY family transcriptional regulator [Rhodothermus sp.]
MRRALVPFGETEMEILQVVWELGEASVADVHARLGGGRAYTTVMTVMRNLAEKGYLTFRRQGRMYVYRPAVPPEEFKANLLQRLVDRVFGSPLELVQTLVRQESLGPDELAELQRLIEKLDRSDDAA